MTAYDYTCIWRIALILLCIGNQINSTENGYPMPPSNKYEDLMCLCPPGYIVVSPCNRTLKISATCQICPSERFKNGWTNGDECTDSDPGEECPSYNPDQNFEFDLRYPYDDNKCQCVQGYYKQPSSKVCNKAECPRGTQPKDPDDRERPPECVTKYDISSSRQAVVGDSGTTAGLKETSCPFQIDVLSNKAIAAIAVLAAVGLLEFIIFAVFCCKKQKTEKQGKDDAETRLLDEVKKDCKNPVQASPEPGGTVNLVLFTNPSISSIEKIYTLSAKMRDHTLIAKRNRRPVKIAVIDTGANLDHPHIQALNIIAKINVLGNSITEDVSDECGHGTQVLSMFYQLFRKDNCLDCVQIVLVKAVNSQSGELYWGDLIKAISLLQKPEFEDVKLINISAGFELKPEFEIKISRLVNDFMQKKILIGASSNFGRWNNDSIAYPAKVGISVGSLNSDGVRSPFSPSGKDLHFMTIGEGFSVANSKYGYYPEEPLTTDSNHGTSLAAPIVTYFAANVLIQLEYHMEGSGYDIARYRKTLETTVGMYAVLRQMSQNTQHSSEMGYGALLPDHHVFCNKYTYLAALTKGLGEMIPEPEIEER